MASVPVEDYPNAPPNQWDYQGGEEHGFGNDDAWGQADNAGFNENDLQGAAAAAAAAAAAVVPDVEGEPLEISTTYNQSKLLDNSVHFDFY